LIDEVQAATIDQDSLTYKYFFYQNSFEQNSGDLFSFKGKLPGVAVIYSAERF